MADGDRLIIPEGIHILGQQDKDTIGDWLKKPERAASRQEVAGFVEAIVQHHVTYLIATAVRQNNFGAVREIVQKTITDTFADMLEVHLAQRADKRWYWRAWRAVTGRPTNVQRYFLKLADERPIASAPTVAAYQPAEPAH